MGIFALETGKTLALTALTFGGYATYRFYAGMWAGYNEQASDGTNMGVVGAINSLNPLYAIARGGLETYRAAEKGDFEAAGEKGVVTAIISAVTVVGVVQGLGALGGKPPSAGAGAGAAEGGAASAARVGGLADLATVRGQLGLKISEGTGDHHMAIGGGKDDRCVVYITEDNLHFWNLEDSSNSPLDNRLFMLVGGQEGDYREAQCVPKDWALIAAREYFDRGERAAGLSWVHS